MGDGTAARYSRRVSPGLMGLGLDPYRWITGLVHPLNESVDSIDCATPQLKPSENEKLNQILITRSKINWIIIFNMSVQPAIVFFQS